MELHVVRKRRHGSKAGVPDHLIYWASGLAVVWTVAVLAYVIAETGGDTANPTGDCAGSDCRVGLFVSVPSASAPTATAGPGAGKGTAGSETASVDSVTRRDAGTGRVSETSGSADRTAQPKIAAAPTSTPLPSSGAGGSSAAPAAVIPPTGSATTPANDDATVSPPTTGSPDPVTLPPVIIVLP